MDPDTVHSLAEGFGFDEVYYSAGQSLIIFETSKQETTATSYVVCVWYDTRTVSVAVPHPRRRRVFCFFFDVTISKLREIFSRPGQNKELKYVGCDWVTHKTSDAETEESALRRQLTAISCEVEDLLREQRILEERLAAIGGPAEKKKLLNIITAGHQSRYETHPSNSSFTSFTEVNPKRKNSTVSSGSVSQKTILTTKRDGLRNSASLITANDASSRLSPRGTRTLSPRSAYDKEDRKSESDNIRPDGSFEDADVSRTFASQKSTCLNRCVVTPEKDSPGRYKGNRCLFSFANEEYQEEFGKSWSLKPVNCVALNRGYIIVYDDGGVAWWDVPNSLDTKFRDVDIPLLPIQYATMGPEGNYFVKFYNGKMEWIARTTFQQKIKDGVTNRLLHVDKVAMGPNGSWVVLWSDGSIDYEDVPKDLSNVFKDIPNSPGLRDISLGPNKEWFVIFKDHSVQANNLPDSLHMALGRIKKEGGRVRSVIFGDMSSWYVRYWDGS